MAEATARTFRDFSNDLSQDFGNAKKQIQNVIGYVIARSDNGSIVDTDFDIAGDVLDCGYPCIWASAEEAEAYRKAYEGGPPNVYAVRPWSLTVRVGEPMGLTGKQKAVAEKIQKYITGPEEDYPMATLEELLAEEGQ